MLSPDVRNVVKDRLVSSPIDHMWTPEPVERSFYLDTLKVIEANLAEGGDWDVLNDVLTGSTLRMTEVIEMGKRFAVFFKEEGIRDGDCVHVVAGNENHTFPIVFGTWILGGTISVGDVNLEPKAVAQQLDDTKAKIAICRPGTEDLLRSSMELSENKNVKAYCLGDSEWCDNVLGLIRDLDPSDCPEAVEAGDANSDVPMIFWTSGTTGRPKGICISHTSMKNFGGFGSRLLPQGANHVTTTCFFHVGGLFTGLYAMIKRGTYFHMFGPSFTLDHLVRTIVKTQPPTVIIGSHHYVHLSEDPLKGIDPDDLTCVKMIAPTGTAVPASCEVKLRQKFKGLQAVLNVYGQTEAGLVSGGVDHDHLGIVYPHVKFKIENTFTGDRCGPGEMGEICAKTPSLMKEYLNRPKETEAYFDFEGFGHTGDLGYYDNEGFIHFVDRLKEIIKYKNNHVSPTELEDILQRHPAVKESMVYGKPDPKVQELISAVVVLNNGKEATEKELVDFVNAEVTDYKKIRGGIIFRDAIPRNSVGKLVRKEMRDWAREQQA